MKIKYLIAISIVLSGAVLSGGILFFPNLFSYKSIAKTSVEWTQKTGEGLSAPACFSSSAASPTCVGGVAQATISWTNKNSAHTVNLDVCKNSWCELIVYTPAGMYDPSGWDAFTLPADGNVTLSPLDSDTTYIYALRDQTDTIVNQFITPNCAPATGTLIWEIKNDGVLQPSSSVVVNGNTPNGPVSNITVPAGTYPGFPVGDYTYSYVSGGPAGATFQSITPSGTQNLSDGGTITFTFNFTTPVLTNNASCGTINVPASVTVGQSFHADVTMNNTGTKPWTTDATPHKLGSANPRDNTIWGTGRVSLPSSPINPGSSVIFSFNPTAPLTTGLQSFSWQMVEDGVEWFGQVCSKGITVNPLVAIPDLIIATGPTANGALVVGTPVTFSATVRNQGGTDIPAGTNFQNRFRADLNRDGSYETTLTPNPTISGLNAGTTSRSITSGSWTPGTAGNYRVEVCADIPPSPDGIVAESNETNNCATLDTTVNTVVTVNAPIIVDACTGDGVSKVNISWDEGVISSAYDPSGGYVVDIDNDGDWGNGFWNKSVPQGTTSTNAPEVFNGVFGQSGPLTLIAGNTYQVRVYYAASNSHSPDGSFTAPDCSVFDYNLSNSGNITVKKGQSGSNTITVTLLSGATQSVSLSASGLPSGATANFGPTSCSPTCASTLTIFTLSSTPVGTYPITVTGSPLGKITTFNLIVNTTGPQPPDNFTLNPPSAVCNSVSLSWTASAGADAYRILKGAARVDISPYQPYTALNFVDYAVSQNTNYLYQIEAYNGAGTNRSNARNVTTPYCPPTLDFSGFPTSIYHGQSTTLTWLSTYATSCTASGAWSGSKAVNGNEIVVPSPPPSITYTLTCSGLGGSTGPQSVIINIAPLALPNWKEIIPR